MIKGFGRDLKDEEKSYKLSEVSLMCDKKDLRKLRTFIDGCIEEMDSGKFNGKNGGHRHYQDCFEGFLRKECDLIIHLNYKGKK